jgi:hypothetical protein
MTTDADADLLPDDTPSTAVALRSPTVPLTLSDLAALKGEALEVIEARVQVIATLRRSSIRATAPEDWVKYKPEDGRVTCYLQDCGADRVRDLWGIEIFNISKPEKVVGQDAGVFTYLITGSGQCKLTRQTVEAMEGGRSSTDDFCKGKTGVDLELTVRKAARANLDGNITRELAGMKSVPEDELKAAWVGTSKSTDHCREGRGYGTRAERQGLSKAPDVAPPVCPHCNTKAAFRQGRDNKPDWYGCPNWEKHKDQRFWVNAAQWVAEQKAKAAQPEPKPAPKPEPKPAPPQPKPKEPLKELHADDIFGREPGQEG